MPLISSFRDIFKMKAHRVKAGAIMTAADAYLESVVS